MTSAELERLVGPGGLKREAPSQTEFEGLVRSGRARLADAGKEDLSLESRFDLAYNAPTRLRWLRFGDWVIAHLIDISCFRG